MVTVSGSGLDALACSLRLSQLSIDHVWLPKREPGGHFAGRITNCAKSQLVDLGMVLLEPGQKHSDISHFRAYRCEEGSESRQFFPSLMSWIHETTGVRLEPHAVETVFRGRRVPDYFIADHLQALGLLEPSEQANVLRELSSVSSEGRVINASSKQRDEASLADALARSLGPTLVNALFGRYLSLFPDVGKIPFQLHRQIWIPMYWTQTVLEAMSTSFQPFTPAQFLGPSKSSIARLVRDMAGMATSSKHRYSAPTPQTSDLLLDFSPPPVKTEFAVDYAIVHFCIATEVERSTVFLADVPHGVSRVSVFPASSVLPHQAAPLSVAAAEIPSPKVPSDRHLISGARRALQEINAEPTCAGEVKRIKFGYGASAVVSGLCGGSSFNESLLSGLSAAERVLSGDV